MRTKQYLLEIIKEQVGSSRIFFVSRDIEHGLYLHSVLQNVIPVFFDGDERASALSSEAKKIRELLKQEQKGGEEADGNVVLPSASSLLEFLIRKNIPQAGDFVMAFKPSAKLEQLCYQNNLECLNTDAKIAAGLENKLEQYELFAEHAVEIPMGISGELGILAENSFVEENLPVVLQFSKGHTGNSTHLVPDMATVREFASKFPKRLAKITKLIDGETYSANACMLKNGQIYLAGIYKQITGLAPFTDVKFATVGGSFAHNLPEHTLQKLEAELEKISKILMQQHYFGIFGIDFVVDAAGNLFVIELNARAQMTANLNSLINDRNGSAPLNLINLAVALDIFEMEPNMLFENSSKNLENLELVQYYTRATDRTQTLQHYLQKVEQTEFGEMLKDSSEQKELNINIDEVLEGSTKKITKQVLKYKELDEVFRLVISANHG